MLSSHTICYHNLNLNVTSICLSEGFANSFIALEQVNVNVITNVILVSSVMSFGFSLQKEMRALYIMKFVSRYITT